LSILLVLVLVFLNIKLLQDGLNGITDIRWHSMWIHHFSKQLTEGIWYPRWLAGVNYGYGSPTFVFYPPLTHYLGSLLRLSGFSIEQSIITIFLFSLFLSGFGFYLYARNYWGIIASFSGSLAYMTAPYLTFNLYSIGSIAVAFAIAWIPFGFWTIDRAMLKPKWLIGLALSWTILALTHLPTLLLCAIVWIPHTLLFLLWRPWQIVVKNILAIGLGLGIASFFLIPAILEQKYVNIDAQKGVIGGGFKNTMFGEGLQLIPLKLDLFLSQVFIQQLTAVILCVIAIFLLLRRTHTEDRKQAKYWLTFAFILAFLMTSWSWSIWSTSETLQKVQAPWRLLHLFTFAQAVLLALTIENIRREATFKKIIIMAMAALIFGSNFAYCYKLSRKYPTFHNPGRADLSFLEASRKALFEEYTEELQDVPEYRPLLKNGQPSPNPRSKQPRYSVVEGEAIIKLIKWQSYQRSFQIDVQKTATINLRTYNYPAWHLYINDQLEALDIANDGTMIFTLPVGISNIKIIYDWTPALIIGTIFSSVNLIILVWWSSRLFSCPTQIGRFDQTSR
jgi:hypothetical protein